MSRKKKLLLYAMLLLIGIVTFVLELFVFQKPDGVLGLIICITSIYLILGSVIKLCRLSSKFKDSFIQALDLFFWLP